MHLWNNVKTGVLLAAITGLFVLLGSAIGGTTGMIIAFVLAVGLNMGTWWFSGPMALKMSGAKPVTEEQAPELHNMVAQLSARANMPKPGVYVIDTAMPNAFATGRSPKHGAVAVTTGLMQMMNRDELAGVVAHELAHIKHRDTLISSIAASIAGAVTMIAEMAMWGMMFSGLGGSDEEEGNGLADMVGGILMIFLAPIAAMIIQMAISRAREFSADAGGAQILGDPLPLASALEKLEMAAGRTPAHVNPAASHMYIVNPLRGGLGSLFRTHPASEERIARLRAMAVNQTQASLA